MKHVAFVAHALAITLVGASCTSILGSTDVPTPLVEAGTPAAPLPEGGGGAAAPEDASPSSTVARDATGGDSARPVTDASNGSPADAAGGAKADASDGSVLGADALDADASPCPGACAVGAIDTEACGNCGTQSRTCTSACQWGAFGACTGEGVCAVSAMDQEACGNCGTMSRTCTSACTWGAFGACGQGVCAPTATSAQACGNCGTQSRTCSTTCNWGAYGSCTGEGACSPGQGSTQACGNCGSQSQTCDDTCSWPGFGACTGQGACAPGTSQTCNSGITNCSGTQGCSDSCSWGSCSPIGCTPFVVVQAGDNNGPYGCGPMTFSNQTCAWTVAATCPAGTLRSSCVAGNPGGRGSCTTAWNSSNPADPTCVLNASVGVDQGTHCSIAISCVGPG